MGYLCRNPRLVFVWYCPKFSIITFLSRLQPLLTSIMRHGVLDHQQPDYSFKLVRASIKENTNAESVPMSWRHHVFSTVYPKKYAHGFVVLCFVVVTQSFIMNSHEVFIHIHQGCFAGTGAIVRLPQCQWSKPDGYGKISQCITTTKHSKAKTVCIFLGIYCTWL